MSGLNFITTDPPNAGVATTRMDGSSLTQSEMYMRNNFSIPKEAPTQFEIVMPGHESRTVTASDLADHVPVELTTVIECAGNGRILMDPVPDGTPWDLGGSSIIAVRGVRLADVLGDLPSIVKEVVFTGADTGHVAPEGTINYEFSISKEHAESQVPILVTHIGGEPLTKEHGAPVRLLVPGHYAMKSVKWITRIEGLTTAFSGHFVNKYRYYGDAMEPEAKPVAEIQVRSAISSPGDGSLHESGEVRLAGSAWTGFGEIEKVEVWTRNTSWTQAAIERLAPGLARWETMLRLPAGRHLLKARASDSAGNKQPLEPRWNENGYANNVCQQIEVLVS